ncbi:MAG: hypothetical protein AAFU49_02940 [Pseudomonadota bacterium]
MNLYTARLLSPVRTRRDWATPRLSYLPSSVYKTLMSLRSFELKA